MQEVALLLMMVLLGRELLLMMVLLGREDVRAPRLQSQFRRAGTPTFKQVRFVARSRVSGRTSKVLLQVSVGLAPDQEILPRLILTWLILPWLFLLGSLTVPRHCLILPWLIVPSQCLPCNPHWLIAPRMIPRPCLLPRP